MLQIVCPVCLQPQASRPIERGGKPWIESYCKEHGSLSYFPKFEWSVTSKLQVATRKWRAVKGDVLNSERPYGIVQDLTPEECAEAGIEAGTVVVAEVTDASGREKQDADLLAAAPELYDACQLARDALSELFKSLESGPISRADLCDATYVGALHGVEDAITKARGVP